MQRAVELKYISKCKNCKIYCKSNCWPDSRCLPLKIISIGNEADLDLRSSRV